MRLSDLLIESEKKKLLDLKDKGILTDNEVGELLDDYTDKCYRNLD